MQDKGTGYEPACYFRGYLYYTFLEEIKVKVSETETNGDPLAVRTLLPVADSSYDGLLLRLRFSFPQYGHEKEFTVEYGRVYAVEDNPVEKEQPVVEPVVEPEEECFDEFGNEYDCGNPCFDEAGVYTCTLKEIEAEELCYDAF